MASNSSDDTAVGLTLFLLLTLVVISIESCVDSSQRQDAAKIEYLKQQGVKQ